MITVLLAFALAADHEFTGKVVHVVDGDTVDVERRNGDKVRVRFLICDAPESNQPFGDKATDFVAKKVLNKTVRVRTEGNDQHGRTLGEIFIDGKSLNKELIRQGLAVWFFHYDSDPKNGLLEVEAKAAKRGLWSQETPLYPRNWRRGARIPSDGPAIAIGKSEPSSSPIVIVAALPNPQGPDAGNERVWIKNRSSAPVDLDGWSVRDDDSGQIKLSGVLDAGKELEVKLTDSLQLGNSGDVIMLHNGHEHVQEVTYTASQARSGAVVKFGYEAPGAPLEKVKR